MADEQQVETKFDWSQITKHWPWLVVIGIAVFAFVFQPASFKQTLGIEKVKTDSANSQIEQLQKELMKTSLDNSSLKEQVTKEKSKSKYLVDYYENGQKKHEEGEASNSNEQRVTELQRALSDMTLERDDWAKKAETTQATTIVKVEKETVRTGDIGLVVGGSFDVSSLSVKPVVGIDARIFELFGLSVRLGAFATR